MVSVNQKPIIILIHGGASSHRMYKTTVPLLQEKGFVCLTPDLPGHGSRAKDGLFTFEGARTVVSGCINGYAMAQMTPLSETDSPRIQVILVGISLGGQLVLSFLQNIDSSLHPNVEIAGAIVSGAFIHPPDGTAGIEIPHLPSEDQTWMEIIMSDVKLAGMENMPDLQAKALAFTFEVEMTKKNFEREGRTLPPVQIMIGENDMAMARRDFEELALLAKSLNVRSESVVLKDAWHNHSIDVPEKFADAVAEWAINTTAN